MRIAAFSDVHSNWPALEAVLADIAAWGDDVQIVVAGDFINFGPYPREVLEAIRALPDAVVIAGNHEEYVLEQFENAKKGPLPAPYRTLFAPSAWTVSQLTQEEIEWLRQLPRQATIAGPKSDIRIVHGSPRKQTEPLRPNYTDAQLQEIFAGEEKAGRLWISGHTHQPLLLQWRDMVITGNGSVGLPIDGDTRACYLRAEWDDVQQTWQVQHRRVEYDRERMIAALAANAAFGQAGPFMRLCIWQIQTGRDGKFSTFLNSYGRLKKYPEPPHDFPHLDEAVSAYLATLE